MSNRTSAWAGLLVFIALLAIAAVRYSGTFIGGFFGDGAGITNLPALVQANIPAIVTNASDSVTIVPFQWGILTTNNNVVFNNLILAGGTVSSNGVTWGVCWVTNNSASTKTVLVPATVAMSGTPLGSTTTCYNTNTATLTVWYFAHGITQGVWRSYP